MSGAPAGRYRGTPLNTDPVIHQIGPLLRECAPEGERDRRLPARAVEALRDADLFRCAAPREVGGLGIDPLTQLEVFEAVTAFDGAPGWKRVQPHERP